MGTNARVRRDGPRPAVIAVAVAIPMLALAAVVAAGGPDGAERNAATSTSAATTSTTAVSAYDAAVEEVFAPLSTALPHLATAISDWGEGALDDAAFSERLAALEPVFAGLPRAVRDIGPHPTEPLATPLLVDTAELYAAAVHVHQQAIDEPDAAARSQMDLLARRLRVLGDRIFDRSHDLTSPRLDPGPGLDLRLPAEIPEWRSLGLAAGPPLTDTPAGGDETPLGRAENRPSQPRARWEAAVAELGVLPLGTVTAMLASGDTTRIDTTADALVVAADALRAMPVPDGDHELVDRLGVGWLVLADAARADQLATMTGRAELAMIAQELAEIAMREELNSLS